MLTKAETIALAEKHGYGTEAALTLLKMSPRMVGDLLAHAEQIDAQDGKDCWLVAKEQTRKALWARGVLEHKTGTKRTCGISELGYRVVGLRLMIREIANRSKVVIIPQHPIHIVDAIGVPACGISHDPLVSHITEDPHEATCTPCIDAVSEPRTSIEVGDVVSHTSAHLRGRRLTVISLHEDGVHALCREDDGRERRLLLAELIFGYSAA